MTPHVNFLFFFCKNSICLKIQFFTKRGYFFKFLEKIMSFDRDKKLNFRAKWIFAKKITEEDPKIQKPYFFWILTSPCKFLFDILYNFYILDTPLKYGVFRFFGFLRTFQCLWLKTQRLKRINFNQNSEILKTKPNPKTQFFSGSDP